jgi:hypothetical protein
MAKTSISRHVRRCEKEQRNTEELCGCAEEHERWHIDGLVSQPMIEHERGSSSASAVCHHARSTHAEFDQWIYPEKKDYTSLQYLPCSKGQMRRQFTVQQMLGQSR